MLLIPVGHLGSTIRRRPWMTYGLIAAYVVMALVAEVFYGRSDAENRRLAALSRARHHIAQHSYVTISPLMQRHLPPEFLADIGPLRTAPTTQSAEEIAWRQAELDELDADLDAALRARPDRRLGFVPAVPTYGTALTSQFLHFGWLHLLGNALFLFLTAPFVEDRYGRLVFAAFCAFCHIAAVSAYGLLFAGSPIALVGSSAVVAGVMAAFLVRFGARRVNLLFVPVVAPTALIRGAVPALALPLLWIAEQVLYFRFAHVEEHAVWTAHVAGFLGGGLAAIALKTSGVEQRISASLETPNSMDPPESLERAIEARAKGDLDEAARELQDALFEDPSHIDSWVEFYEYALATGNPSEVARSMERLFEIYATRADPVARGRLLADRRWSELGPMPPALYLRVGEALEAEGDGRRALAIYQRAVDETPQGGAALEALVRRGAIFARNGAVRDARDAYQRALKHPLCDARWRDYVDSEVAELPPPPPLPSVPDDDTKDIYVREPLLPGEPPRDKKRGG
jgi:membrane associated rhomboid family serine protease